MGDHFNFGFLVFQVHAVELGPHQAGNLALGNHNDHITFTDSDENQTFDFPVSLQVQRVLTIHHNYTTDITYILRGIL